MGVISSLLMIVSQGMVGFGVSFIFCALGNNLNSGSEEALVYDTMKELGTEKGYLKVNGKMHVMIEASIGIATIVGGILAEKSYTLCYLCAVVIGGISILPAVYMEEPEYSEQKEEKVTIRGHFKKSIELIKGTPQVLKILLHYPTVAAFYVALYFYGQQFYAEFGFTKVEISIIMLVASSISCIGAASGEWFILRVGGKTKYWAALVMGGSILVTSTSNPVLSISGFFMASFLNSLLEPIGSSALNELIPSKQRATILSVDSMFFSMAMIVFFPIGGAIATKFNLHMTFRMLGLVEIAMILLIVRRKSNTTTKKHR